MSVIRLALTSLVVVLGCSASEPITVSDRLRILDDNDAIVNVTDRGTSLEVAYVGAFAALNIAPDDYVVGTHGQGYLRKVLSVAPDDANQTAILVTQVAALSEVVESGHFTETVTVGAAQNARAGRTLVDLTGKVLVDETGPNGSLKITMDQGTVSFVPEVTFDVDFGFFSIEKFEAIGKGTLDANFDVTIAATAAYNGKGNVDVGGPGPAYTQDFSFKVGPIPVEGRIDLYFRGGYELNTAAAGDLSTGFDATASVEAGARYLNSTWDWIWNTNFDANAHPTTWAYTATGSAKVYVAPVIKTYFYGQPGPEIDLSKHWDGDFDYQGMAKPSAGGLDTGIDLDPPGIAAAPAKFALCAGAGAKLSYVLKVFSFELASYEHTIPGTFQTLETAGGGTCPQSGPDGNDLNGNTSSGGCADLGAGWVPCPATGDCIHESWFCDGMPDCPNGEDEQADQNMQACPG